MLNDSNLIILSRVHNGLVFDRVYMEVRHSLLYYVLLLICTAGMMHQCSCHPISCVHSSILVYCNNINVCLLSFIITTYVFAN